MTVDSFSDKLSAYIDGELPDADRVEMEKMISEIPECLALHENMILLQERLGNLPEFQPSAEFEFGLRSQILLEAAKEMRVPYRVKQIFFRTTGRSVLSGAIAAMLAMGVSVLLQGEPKGDVTASQVSPAGIEQVAPLDAAQAIQFYDAMNERVATVPTQPVDRGALKQLSQQESYVLSRQLYQARTDSPLSRSATDPRTRPVVQKVKARPVNVSF
jgi:negative regulator of sigma E activity